MVAKDKTHPVIWLWNLNFLDIEKYKANKIKPETIVSFKPYKMVNDKQNGEKQKSEKRVNFELWLNSFLKFKSSVEVKYKGIRNSKKKIIFGKELFILIKGRWDTVKPLSLNFLIKSIESSKGLVNKTCIYLSISNCLFKSSPAFLAIFKASSILHSSL